MDPISQQLLSGAAGGGASAYVDEVFSTWLYDGNSSTQTIANGIDLSGKGGMVWIRGRISGMDNNLYDTNRGATELWQSNTTNNSMTSAGSLTSFNSNGFSLGSYSAVNANAANYVSWTFRKQPKFFDVVTYNGDGASSRAISHSLSSTPGFIIVKRLNLIADSYAYHKSLFSGEYMILNSSASANNNASYFPSNPTDSTFTVGTSINSGAGTYVAYLFADNAGGFGDSGGDSIITCGVYNGNGSATGPTVTLGWEPQWLMIKNSSNAGGDWNILDNMRGFVVNGADAEINANTSTIETSGVFVTPTSTGFQLNTTDTSYNGTSNRYLYVAIRRGPMKRPTSGAAIFQPKVYTGTNLDNRLVTTDIVTDMAWIRQRNDTVLTGLVVGDRMRGQPYMLTGSTAAEVNDADSFDAQLISTVEYGTAWSSMTGVWVGNDPTSKLNLNTTSNNHVVHAFRRAAGFFDIVCYAGTSSTQAIKHNLNAVPELIIVKARGSSDWWIAYSSVTGNNNYVRFDDSISGVTSDNSAWNNTDPTSLVFTVGPLTRVNVSTGNFVAYLFASCPGVSKVGSYIGSGSNTLVNCGFTSGARFVMVRRTSAAGSWYIWDTARGINASANDPFMTTSSSSAETSNTNYIDPYSAGFQINSSAPADLNAAGNTFLFLAIA